MSNLQDKTTIYLDPMVKKYLQHRAIEEDSSISEIINESFVRKMRRLKLKMELDKIRKEPTVSFDEALAELGLSYADLRD